MRRSRPGTPKNGRKLYRFLFDDLFMDLYGIYVGVFIWIYKDLYGCIWNYIYIILYGFTWMYIIILTLIEYGIVQQIQLSFKVLLFLFTPGLRTTISVEPKFVAMIG